MMTIQVLHQAIFALAQKRNAFWAEADFQFELAFQLQKTLPRAEVRLERPFPGEGKSRNYIDIVIHEDGKMYPIELKYKTKASMITDVNGEEIILRDHSALDFNCYDYLKDIQRLEMLRSQPNFESGFAVMLTNESAYYNNTGRRSAYENFKLYDGAVRGGKELDWNNPNFKHGGRTKFPLLDLYTMQWHPYNNGKDGFKYLINEINKHN